MTIYLLGESCVRAGTAVPEPSGDTTTYDGDYAELKDRARALLRSAERSHGGHGSYLRQCAYTLIGEIGAGDTEGLPAVRYRVGRWVADEV